MRALVGLALLLLTACGTATTTVAEPDRPGLAAVALDRDSGKLLWRTDISPASAATDPVLVARVVLVATSGPLIAYDARSGERLWSLEDAAYPPQVAGRVAVLAGGTAVQAVDPRSGRSLWQQPVEQDAQVFSGPGRGAAAGARRRA